MILERTRSRTIVDKVRRFDHESLRQLQKLARESFAPLIYSVAMISSLYDIILRIHCREAYLSSSVMPMPPVN